MEAQARFRHELKYDVGYAEYLALRARLRAVMKPDAHAGADGRYYIRSIYFDNYRDKALREKLTGVASREKFRIRWYNNDLSFIALEKKQKLNSLCLKLDARISESELRLLLGGEAGWTAAGDSELVREFGVKLKTQHLRPRVAVAYTREPYVFEAGNVRLTFDSDIRSSLYSRDFLADGTDVCVADEPGRIVLEVKYDAFLPDIIADIIQTDGCRAEAFSKYGSSRRFG